jgi:hypothetical protein
MSKYNMHYYEYVRCCNRNRSVDVGGWTNEMSCCSYVVV